MCVRSALLYNSYAEQEETWTLGFGLVFSLPASFCAVLSLSNIFTVGAEPATLVKYLIPLKS